MKGFLSIGPLTVIIVIGIIILLLMPLYFMISYRYSETKRAIYYTSKLRDAIDSACSGGQKEITFNVQQKLPGSIMNGAYITSNGDPEFVIYYESFKPGTGYSWEWYYGELPENLLFIYLNTSSKNPAVMPSYEKKVIKEANDTLDKSVPNREFYPIIVNVEEGNWTPVKSLGRIKYYTKKLQGNEDKMMYKYKFCMNNSICLKTKNYVYAFPLKCDLNGSIILSSPISSPYPGGPDAYYTPLSIASPCSGTFSIYASKCSCKVYKKYKKDDNGLHYIGNYTICNQDDAGKFKCIVVEEGDVKGFCSQTPGSANLINAILPVHGENYTIVRYDAFTNQSDPNAMLYTRWPYEG